MKSNASARTTSPLGATVLGRYHIESYLRSEPRGECYLARGTSADEAVVVKLLSHPLLADRDAHASWAPVWEYAGRLQRLDHPNVERVLECGLAPTHDSDVFCVVTTAVEGETLHARVRREGRLAVVDAVMIGQQIARGMAAAHRQGIVHGDLRATNVVMANTASNDGAEARAVLCDVGLTNLVLRAAQASPSLREMMSAPECIAPEQIRGEPATIATDIYAFGAVFFRMLAGRTPFHADNTSQMLRAHLTRAIPTLRERGASADVPASVEALVRRCLAKRPEDRFDCLDALLAGLQECEANVITIATHNPPSWMTQLRPASVAPLGSKPALVSRRPTPSAAGRDAAARPSAPGETLDIAPMDEETDIPALPSAPARHSAPPPRTQQTEPRESQQEAMPTARMRRTPTLAVHPDREARKEPTGAQGWFYALATVTLLASVAGGYAMSPIRVPRATPPPAATHAPAPTPRVRFEVRSVTRGAQAVLRGRTYPAPFEVELAPGTEPEMVELSAPRHTSRRVWIVLDQPMAVQIDLEREAPASEPALTSPTPARARAPQRLPPDLRPAHPAAR